MKRYSLAVAYLGILFALVAVLVYFGYIPIIPGLINIAVLPMLIVMMAPQVFGWKMGVAVSTFWGVMSLCNAFLRPTTITAPYFQNPIISIFPRILVGLAVFGASEAFRKLFVNAKSTFVKTILPAGISAGIGTIVNTLFVLGLMALMYGANEAEGYGTVLDFIMSIVWVNWSIEFTVCILFVPPLVIVMRKTVGDRFLQRMKEV